MSNGQVIGAFSNEWSGKGWRIYLRKFYKFQRALGVDRDSAKLFTVQKRWNYGFNSSFPPRCERQIGIWKRPPHTIRICPATALPGSPFCQEHQ